MKLKLKDKIKLYLGLIIIVLLIGVLGYELYIGTNKVNKKSITYTKESNTSYVTYLKDNTHYSNTYLENDYNFVASLVDYFNIDYMYSYVLNESIDYTLNYELIGVLEVYDSENNTKPIEKKVYNLLDKTTTSGSGQVIKVELFNQRIDYDTYNRVVQAWKKEVSPEATLKVTMNVSWTGYSNKLEKEISDSYSADFIIPMASKTINIVNPHNLNETGTINSHEKLDTLYFVLLLSTLLLLLVILVPFTLYAIRLKKKQSKYELKINKILREFDRAITEAKGSFKKNSDLNYIEVNDFMELLDAHDNLGEPIIYYKNNDDSSTFVVRNKNDIYYSTINRKDYE